MDVFPNNIKKALSLYNAPPFPYNTKKDFASINKGEGRRRHHIRRRTARGKVARGKVCKRKCKK
jgi:hypothetical protein